MAKKRNLFDELINGAAAMKARRAGKITLPSHNVEPRTSPETGPNWTEMAQRMAHAARLGVALEKKRLQEILAERQTKSASERTQA
jgi:hypothetical protein